ncbi:MAG TPA: hypothetical protein VGL59_10570 [Polyangia bacterium]
MSTRGFRSPAAPLIAGLLLSVAGIACDPGAGSPGGISEGTAAPFQGELTATIATFDDGHSETDYALRISGTDEPRLIFASPPDVAPGQPIGVWGERHGDDIAVSSYSTLVPREDVQQSALVSATPKPDRKFAFVLVDTGAGVSLTSAQAQSLLFKSATGIDTSLAHYYLEESYGIQTLSGDVVGPLKFQLGNCDTRGLTTALRPMIPTAYDQYGWYFNRSNTCGWAGLASVGVPSKPSKDTWFNGSAGCVVLAQEPGHNFGMQHSSTISCKGGALTDDVTACVHSEYGDPYDPMGHGCYHMNMYQKAYQGWVQGCNSVLTPSSGTFDIFPMELACNAIQVLQVPMPKTRPFTRPAAGGGGGGVTNLAYYYIEYRQLSGNFEKAAGNVFQGVLIHAGEQYRTIAQGGRYPYLLDMTPETATFNDAALGVGKSFTDPAGGVTITVMSADATKATVKIDIAGGTGMPTCIDGTTLAAPGPQSCGAGGGIVVGSDGGTVITSDAGTGTMNTMDAGRADTGAAGGRNGGGGNGTGGRSGTGGTGEPLPGADASADVPPAGTNGNGGSTMLPMADAGMPGAPMGKAGDGAVSGCACTTVDPVGPRSTSVALSSLLLATVVASRRRRRQ